MLVLVADETYVSSEELATFMTLDVSRCRLDMLVGFETASVVYVFRPLFGHVTTRTALSIHISTYWSTLRTYLTT